MEPPQQARCYIFRAVLTVVDVLRTGKWCRNASSGALYALYIYKKCLDYLKATLRAAPPFLPSVVLHISA